MVTRTAVLLAGAGIQQFPPPVLVIREHPGKTYNRASLSVHVSSSGCFLSPMQPAALAVFSCFLLPVSTRPVSPEAHVNSSREQPLPARPTGLAPAAEVTPQHLGNDLLPVCNLLLAPRFSPGAARGSSFPGLPPLPPEEPTLGCLLREENLLRFPPGTSPPETRAEAALSQHLRPAQLRGPGPSQLRSAPRRAAAPAFPVATQQ